jgi:5,10-methylenetetrahydromethanopterin reductase
MKLSCGLFPNPDIVEQAKLAESLGYERVWVYDSPALYTDVWIALARIAEATERIGLGPAVLIPSLRHVLVTASAIATVEELAPGRLAVAIGTGFTGRRMLGKKALPWRDVARYIEQLRGLLRGEEVEVDGAITKMAHPATCAPARPLKTPIVVAANGPKGLDVAKRLGDGVMCVAAPQPGFDWCALLAFGTVLDEGEDVTSARAFETLAPGISMIYHGTYEASPQGLDALPGGPGWREEIEAIPERVRHMAVHEGHLVEITERDRRHISPALGGASFSGTPEALRARVRDWEQAGLTELLYAPNVSFVERELRAMADAVGPDS